MEKESAFGHPGIEPRWSSSSKDGVGTALTSHSRVWFTISHGIINEVYYPRIDIANTRDIQFIVTSSGFFSEERKDTIHATKFSTRGVPLFEIENTSKSQNYTIRKTVFTDPDADVLIQRVIFIPIEGEIRDYSLHLLLAPHLNNGGKGNNAWVGDYKGTRMLYACKDGICMAACADTPFGKMSCGYVGYSDAWQDIHAHGRMTWEFQSARDGNVAMGAEIDLPANGAFTLYTGFGDTPEEAALKVRYTMLKDYDLLIDRYRDQWLDYFHDCDIRESETTESPLYETSLSIIKVHQAKDQFPGALIASLSIPWGSSMGDEERGGYHLVWPRDMVESAIAQLSAGEFWGALSALRFLMVTQEEEGRWFQNMWLDGTGYWGGVQLDEVGFPILLADRLRKNRSISRKYAWNMVKRAASFLLRSGPATPQDRWEEDGGLSPFTISVEVAALLAASDMAAENNEPEMARILTETADFYNSNIERWTYVTGTELAKKVGVNGYYVRISPADTAEHLPETSIEEYVPLKNRPQGENEIPSENEVSVDALALVRFGLREASDPRIMDTVKVIDHLLRTETRNGPVWHRYNGDGYGEHEDGSPFDGTGTGRGWPLFSGERAHYEIAAGNIEEAKKLRKNMEKQTSPGGLIPEQIWDSEDNPAHGLRNGEPSGSAMPLVWAHAEYLKLCRSIEDGEVFDMPPQTRSRYIRNVTGAKVYIWAQNNMISWIPVGVILRVSVFEPAGVHWTSDEWKSHSESQTKDSGLGIHYTDLDTSSLGKNTTITFTMHWIRSAKWDEMNHSVKIL